MQDLFARLTSRKFLLTLVAVIAAISVAIQDGLVTQSEVWTMLAPILAYLGVEGAADAVARYVPYRPDAVAGSSQSEE